MGGCCREVYTVLALLLQGLQVTYLFCESNGKCQDFKQIPVVIHLHKSEQSKDSPFLHIPSVFLRVFHFQKNLKYLDQFYKMDLDFRNFDIDDPHCSKSTQV